jgi:hypothetical protein
MIAATHRKPVLRSFLIATTLGPRELLFAQQRTMRVADAVIVASYNVALRVDPKRYGCPRPRCIDFGKGAFPQKKPMRDKVGVSVLPNSIATRVDPIRLRTPPIAPGKSNLCVRYGTADG